MEILEKYREEKGLTKTQLADLLGISPAMISLIVSGARQPGFALTRRIEEITGIPRALLRPDIFGDAA